ncbi:MAG: high-potential iron-sulfur protein [Novosphingobium sp.]
MTSRRRFLAIAGLAPILLTGLGRAAVAAETKVCFDPETLSASQKSRRKSLGFNVVSPDPKKICGGCAFYAMTTAGCGKCQLLSGGPVAATSNCRSWAKKA